MLEIIHKKVKLNVDEILISQPLKSKKQAKDTESQTTKYVQEQNFDQPTIGECINQFTLDQETLDLLKYSYDYGIQIISKIYDSPLFIEKLRSKSIKLKKELLIFFLNNVRVQSTQLHDLIYLEANNLDKDIRQAAVECMSRFKVKDEQEILNLIRKPKDSQDLLNNHHLGLLVSILEDQYYQIRINAIKTIQNFNKQSTIFSNQVLEILINMLNDESDAVRIEAIQALLNYPKIEFNRGDSNAIKFNLNEHNFKLRKAIYDLIGQSVFTESLYEIFEAVCQNVKRFPQDFTYIAHSIRQLSIKNPNILQTQDIIKKERMGKEPNLYTETSEYVVRMIYAFYSQRKDTDPFYFPKHFAYFSDKFPELFQSNKISPDEFYAYELFDKYKQLMQEVQIQQKMFKLQECINTHQELLAKYDFDQQEIIPPPPLDMKDKLMVEVKLPNFTNPKFKIRQFKFILPIENTSFKINSEYTSNFDVQGEYSNLKQPISTHYAFKLSYMDGTFELNRIYSIEDNLIRANVEVKKKILDFSQPAKIAFVQLSDGQQIGNYVNIYLQI